MSGVGFLRAFSRVRAIEQALREIKHRFGMRVVHYSIQGNHLHLIVEIDDPSMLPRAIQGLAVRLAKTLNGRLAHIKSGFDAIQHFTADAPTNCAHHGR